MQILIAIIAGVLCLPLTVGADATWMNTYPWLETQDSVENLATRIAPPAGYQRIESVLGSFEFWLQHLPLKPDTALVYLFNGSPKPNQAVHYAVIDIGVGKRDLQQCADAIIRLRAEYLYSVGDYDKIHFNFTSGDTAWLGRWFAGYRPVINGNDVRWIKSAHVDSSANNFRKYLEIVFTYAGSYSLSKELVNVDQISEMKIGDVFIEGSFPGHAVIVIDMAVKPETGDKVFLLTQSYMPAQDIHVLKNYIEPKISPWYKLDFGERLETPEWRFNKRDLKRFR